MKCHRQLLHFQQRGERIHHESDNMFSSFELPVSSYSFVFSTRIFSQFFRCHFAPTLSSLGQLSSYNRQATSCPSATSLRRGVTVTHSGIALGHRFANLHPTMRHIYNGWYKTFNRSKLFYFFIHFRNCIHK